MELKEAMVARHTVRKFRDIPLSAEDAAKLIQRVEENNTKLGTAIRLVQNDDKAFGTVLKVFLAKGAKNYFVLAGDPEKDLEEQVGYASADLMLYAQTLGLNTWWVGGTFSRNAVDPQGNQLFGILVVGYGEEQGKPHRSVSFEKIASYEGEMPQWFKDGVDAVLLAPTAVNRQAFTIKSRGNEVSISYVKGFLGKSDLGIGKYFFELGAGKENFVFVEE